MTPQPPNVDGLPGWVQIVVSLAFLALTAVAVGKSYAHPKSRGGPGHGGGEITIAHLSDMSAVRDNTDAHRALAAELISVGRIIGENTHYLRENNDLSRETCQRLRELRERLDRMPGL